MIIHKKYIKTEKWRFFYKRISLGILPAILIICNNSIGFLFDFGKFIVPLYTLKMKNHFKQTVSEIRPLLNLPGYFWEIVLLGSSLTND